MRDAPLISILTPCFNSGEYLEGCIQSVLAQDYPHIEHLVQDGASTDQTRAILEKYSDRLDWASEPDKGQSDGLNRALQRSRGEILLVLNADDELLPHACSWAAEQFAAYPDAAVIYGDQYNIDPAGKIIKRYEGPHPYDYYRLYCVEDIIPAQAAFIRRSSLEAVGFYADISYDTCPDFEMWVRLGMAFPFVYVPEVLARYRVHPQSQGCQPEWMAAFVTAKQRAIDQAALSPAFPAAMRRLRRRARSGVLWWSCDVQLQNGLIRESVSAALRAFAADPRPAKWARCLGFFAHLREYTSAPGWRIVSTLAAAIVFLPKRLRRIIRKPQEASRQ